MAALGKAFVSTGLLKFLEIFRSSLNEPSELSLVQVVDTSDCHMELSLGIVTKGK